MVKSGLLRDHCEYGLFYLDKFIRILLRILDGVLKGGTTDIVIDCLGTHRPFLLSQSIHTKAVFQYLDDGMGVLRLMADTYDKSEPAAGDNMA